MQPSPTLFDTHIHLDAEPLGRDPQDEVRRARREQIGGFLVPGVRREGWSRLMDLARSIDGVRAAPGLHPLASGGWDAEAADELRRLLQDPLVVAVGEIGLDGHLDVPMEIQEAALRGQLRLAVGAGLPVLIHCRRATGRLLEILREERAEQVGGIFHAFSGSLETARQALDLDFALGFGGALTFPNARRPPEVLASVPSRAIVLETDAPDLTPHPHRGEPNRPEYLTLVARKVAEVRGWSLEETARVTTANARRVLKIGDEGP